ncbi:MAG: IclR family transcriptional regulator [Xanthobacteraceae bacterium]
MNQPAVNIASRETPEQTPSPSGVGLLQKAFQLLDLFTDERPAWTQAELARETGLARSTLSRLVRFMASRGFLIEQYGRYRLGFAAIDLGRRAQRLFNLVELCHDLLEELARATSETVILTGYDEAGSRVVCLAQIPSRQGGLRVYENIGTAYPLHSGATAKAVLAFLPTRQIEAVLAGDLTPVNPLAVVDREALRAQLTDIRSDGLVITHEETYPGVTGLAVPLLTPRGQPLGSIGLAGPMQRMTDTAVEAGARHLRDIGNRAASRIRGQS